MSWIKRVQRYKSNAKEHIEEADTGEKKLQLSVELI